MITNGVLNFGNNAITWDPTKKGTSVTLSSDKLTASFTAATAMCLGTVGKSSGKWYWEIEIASGSNGFAVGVAQVQANYNTTIGAPTTGWGYTVFFTGSYKISGGVAPAYGIAFTTGDRIGIALDMNSNSITMYVNNAPQGVMYSTLYGTVFPAVGSYLYPANYIAHFSAGSFLFTPPAGYIALTP